MAHYHIQNTQAHHAPALAELQRTVFPTLSDSERMAAPHYLRHIELFPEGQIVVLHGERVIASSSSIRHSFPQKNHRFLDVSGQLWLDTHQPDGDWLYGMDLGVHPDYRGRGIARAIYQARRDLCHRLGLRGQVIVGMLNGYAAFSEKMSVVEYFDRLMRHELSDPTISAQVRIGFEPLHLMPDYLDDPQCGNAGVLMRWEMMNDESRNADTDAVSSHPNRPNPSNPINHPIGSITSCSSPPPTPARPLGSTTATCKPSSPASSAEWRA